MSFFEQKKLILADFNFDKINKVLSFLDIKYDTNEGSPKVPSKEQLVAIADFCIEQAKLENFYSIGGFEATISEGIIELSFVLERVNLLKNLISEESKAKNEVQGNP